MTLAVNNLGLQAAGKKLVEGLDITVGAGECWFVYGRNGVGKTTLLQTLAGLRKPWAGSVWLEGENLFRWQPQALARRRAYLPQSRPDAFGFTVFETVLAARFPYRAGKMWESAEDREMAARALEHMDVFQLAGRDVRTLSGGERQRVAIATLLAQDTPLMLLDEPATALDLAHQAALMKTIAGLCRERKKAVVTVVHDLNLAWEVATHVLLLHGDGNWEAGMTGDMMKAEKLSRCLHYPVEAMVHGGRPVFVCF